MTLAFIAVLLVVAMLVTAGMVSLRRAGRKAPFRSALIQGALWTSLACSMLMAAIVVILCAWTGVDVLRYLAPQIATSASSLDAQALTALPQVPAASGAASEARPALAAEVAASTKSASPPDALANTLTAIGAVVAIVTLVLSLAVTWFMGQLKGIEEAAQQLRMALGASELRGQAIDALLVAKDALLKWAADQGIDDPGLRAQEWAIRLEMLMSSDARRRFTAFGELQVLNSMPKGLRVDVAGYANVCDELRRTRAVSMNAERDVRAPLNRIEAGSWCRLFDEQEQAAYQELLGK